VSFFERKTNIRLMSNYLLRHGCDTDLLHVIMQLISHSAEAGGYSLPLIHAEVMLLVQEFSAQD